MCVRRSEEANYVVYVARCRGAARRALNAIWESWRPEIAGFCDTRYTRQAGYVIISPAKKVSLLSRLLSILLYGQIAVLRTNLYRDRVDPDSRATDLNKLKYSQTLPPREMPGVSILPGDRAVLFLPLVVLPERE